MVRQSQVQTLATVYLVVGLSLFFWAMYWASIGWANSYHKLTPEGEPLEPARALSPAARRIPEELKYVPPAIPTAILY